MVTQVDISAVEAKWLLAILCSVWGVTLVLAGLLGKSVNDKLASIVSELKELREAHQQAEVKAAVNHEKVDNLAVRVTRIEETCVTQEWVEHRFSVERGRH